MSYPKILDIQLNFGNVLEMGGVKDTPHGLLFSWRSEA